MFKVTGIAKDKISFDFSGDSKYIRGLKKLSSLKWELKYHDYDPNNSPENNWQDDLAPADLRRYMGMMINYGFMITSNEFHEGLIAEDILDNGGSRLLTKAEKEEIYQRMLDKEFFQMGKVVNVSGLGGGNVIGLAEHVLQNYLVNNQFSFVSHEFGHMLGYNHTSGMTLPQEILGVNAGVFPLTKRINEVFLLENRYPVTEENYFDLTDFEE